MKIRLRSFNLELNHTFTISRDSYDRLTTLIIELQDGRHLDIGKAPSNSYYGIKIKKIIDDISSVRKNIESISSITPEEFWSQMFPLLQNNMFALCALDIAYKDLYIRKMGVKLFDYWGFSKSHNPRTNYTIGIDTIEYMVDKLKERLLPRE